jgi:Holliday junction DNA helicase RuvA
MAMISFLRGKVFNKQPPLLEIDVNGVGYQVSASMNTFYRLPEEGEQTTLLTHMVVREDAQLLFGFAEAQERELFRKLIKVNGVGSKLALAILSNMAVDEFVSCVADSDAAALVKMPGVGKKTAERLIVEMRDKLSSWASTTTTTSTSSTDLPTAISQVIQDATSALVALGYKPQDAAKSVKRIATADLSREELIKLALQQIG